MVPERTCPMMVLPMDVIRYRSPDRDELGPGCNGQKPSLAYDEFQDIRQGDARFTPQDPFFLIEMDEAIQAGYVQECAAVINAAIPVATTESVR